MKDNGKEFVAFAIGIITGLTIGAIATLLTTPFTGAEMRSRITKGTKDALKKLREAKDQIEKEIEEKAKGLKGEAAEKVAELRKKVDETFAKLEDKLIEENE